MLINGCHLQLLLSLLPKNTAKIQVHPLNPPSMSSSKFVYFSAGDYGLTRGGSNTNYPYNEADNSPGSYDNKIHVSEIYGNRM
jgi:hypothetical protein